MRPLNFDSAESTTPPSSVTVVSTPPLSHDSDMEFCQLVPFFRQNCGRFLRGGIILGSPRSRPDLFLYTITLPAVSRDAPPTLSYTTLETASRVLLLSKKTALGLSIHPSCQRIVSDIKPKELWFRRWRGEILTFSTANMFRTRKDKEHYFLFVKTALVTSK
jgi:hypothetical protein